MRALLRPRFWRALRYRACVTGVCLTYLLAALEIPLPAAIHKESDQPFPCQNHVCGCQTAEQCWRHCCCFTAEERWAWAKARNVEPPTYAEKPTPQETKVAELPADDGWNTVKLRDRDKGVQVPAEKNCCRQQGARCCSASTELPTEPALPKGERIRWGSQLDASRCQGYSTVWITVGAVLPAQPKVAWLPDWIPPSLTPFTSMTAEPISLAPPSPPPRRNLR